MDDQFSMNVLKYVNLGKFKCHTILSTLHYTTCSTAEVQKCIKTRMRNSCIHLTHIAIHNYNIFKIQQHDYAGDIDIKPTHYTHLVAFDASSLMHNIHINTNFQYEIKKLKK